MKRSSFFKSEMLGFYLSINDLPITADGDVPEDQCTVADAIHHKAYELLEQSLPESRLWRTQDEHEPYEVCEESLEMEDIDGKAAYDFWIYSSIRFNKEVAAAFQAEVVAAYAKAAEEHGGTTKLLRVESAVTTEVIETTELDLAS